jgi:competence protein ComEC
VSSLDVSYSRFIDVLERAKIPMVQVLTKAPLAAVGGVAISSLNGDAAIARSHNNSSMVLRFSFGTVSILFTGDIESAGERALIENRGELHATILKVPHHGSGTSSTAAFIASVHPQAAVISDGYLNNFHFPADAVVERYIEAGAILMRTDLDGAVMVDAKPEHMIVRTFHGRGNPIRIPPAAAPQ